MDRLARGELAPRVSPLIAETLPNVVYRRVGENAVRVDESSDAGKQSLLWSERKPNAS